MQIQIRIRTLILDVTWTLILDVTFVITVRTWEKKIILSIYFSVINIIILLLKYKKTTSMNGSLFSFLYKG